MKLIRRHALYFTVCGLMGLGLTGVGLSVGRDRVQLLSFGIAMMLVCAVQLVRLIRLKHDPKRLEQYELQQNEERLVFLAAKSRSILFFATVGAEYLAMLGLMLCGSVRETTLLGTVIALQMFGYVAVYAYLKRKY